MEQQISLETKLAELKILQYDMVLCIRQAFDYPGASLPVIYAYKNVDWFGIGTIIVRPDVINSQIILYDVVTEAEEKVAYTSLQKTLPILRDRVITHLAARLLLPITW